VGKGKGRIKALEVAEETKKKQTGGVVTNLFKGLVGGKTIGADDIAPSLEKLKDHLISKNVAAEVSSQICDSVAKKLEGKVIEEESGIDK
jgi:signal recognition particle receptor subunit alpha